VKPSRILALSALVLVALLSASNALAAGKGATAFALLTGEEPPLPGTVMA